MEAILSVSLRLVSRTNLILAAGVLGMGSISAFAGVPNVDLSMDWNYGSSGGDPGTTNQYTIHDAESWGYNGGSIWMQGSDRDGVNPDGSDDTWRLDWHMETVAPGVRGTTEFVQANLAVFNNTLATQTYWVLQTHNAINVGPSGVNSNGSVSATVLDVTGDNATMQNISTGSFAGDPIYRSYINGTPQAALWSSGYSLSASGAGASNSDSDNFINVVGPGAATSIGVWLKFEVSPLDSVTISGYYEVSPVPAPAAVPALLGMFGLTVGRRRRRS